MDRACPEFERYRQRMKTWMTGAERREWEAHVAECPACRDQRAAEEALGALFSGTAPPGLSSGFTENLRQRIAEEQSGRNRWPMLVMQGYWLTAAVISAIILLNVEGLFAHMGFTAMTILLICFFGPTLLLSRKMHFGLFDLIISTMTPPEKPGESYPSELFS